MCKFPRRNRKSFDSFVEAKKKFKKMRKVSELIGKKKEVEAVKKAIWKWMAILYANGKDLGCKNCALCYEFDGCYGCPVYEATDERGCKGSPYEEWRAHHDVKHNQGLPNLLTGGPIDGSLHVICEQCREIARKEISFLKGLLTE